MKNEIDDVALLVPFGFGANLGSEVPEFVQIIQNAIGPIRLKSRKKGDCSGMFAA